MRSASFGKVKARPPSIVPVAEIGCREGGGKQRRRMVRIYSYLPPATLASCEDVSLSLLASQNSGEASPFHWPFVSPSPLAFSHVSSFSASSTRVNGPSDWNYPLAMRDQRVTPRAPPEPILNIVRRFGWRKQNCETLRNRNGKQKPACFQEGGEVLKSKAPRQS